MFGVPKKPFTAVTVQVDRLTSETYEENDVSGIIELIESIQLQDSGPREASRAIRKKLKYGNVHRQLRTLTILDALIANAGKTFQRSFADEPLLERLRIAATDPMTDPEVKAKCKILFGQWSVAYKDKQGLASIAGLYRQLPRSRPKPKLRESSPAGNEPSSPTHRRNASSGNTAAQSLRDINSSNSRQHQQHQQQQYQSPSKTFSHSRQSSKKTKQDKTAPFNLEKEKDALVHSLASTSIASTNLTNSLRFINRENERASDNPEVMKRFEACKVLRRQILRYIQFVESEQYLGSLIQANETLVEALTYFERMDKPIDEDSDSEVDEWNTRDDEEDVVVDGAIDTMSRMGLSERRGKDGKEVTTSKGKGRYQQDEPENNNEDDDPDNPFGDSYAVLDTPAYEKPNATWKVV